MIVPEMLVPVRIGTCKDCKWWSRPTDGEIRGTCVLVDNMLENEFVHSPGGCIETSPEFGCVLFGAE